jgi:hypothetical protein
MDLFSFLLGVGVTVLGGLLLYWVTFLIERPSLEVQEGVWKEKKWVGTLLDNIKYYSTDRGGEAWVDGYDFLIYGISIKNKRRQWLSRKTAKINSTTIVVFNKNGDQVNEERECRWWSHDLSSLDNLFVPAKVDIERRRNIEIPEDVSRNLVISYCHLGQSEYRLFAIDSDRVGRFNSNDDRIKGSSPHYALIRVRGDNTNKDFKLEVTTDKNNLSVRVLKEFPFE